MASEPHAPPETDAMLLYHADIYSGCERSNSGVVRGFQDSVIRLNRYVDVLGIPSASIVIASIFGVAFITLFLGCFCCCFNGCCGRFRTYQKMRHRAKGTNPFIDFLENRVVSRSLTVWIFLFTFTFTINVMLSATLFISPAAYFPSRVDSNTKVTGVMLLCKSPIGAILEATIPTLFNSSSPIAWVLGDLSMKQLLLSNKYDCSNDIADGSVKQVEEGYLLPEFSLHVFDRHHRGLSGRLAKAEITAFKPQEVTTEDTVGAFNNCSAWGTSARAVSGFKERSGVGGVVTFKKLTVDMPCAGTFQLVVTCEGYIADVQVRLHSTKTLAQLEMDPIDIKWITNGSSYYDDAGGGFGGFNLFGSYDTTASPPFQPPPPPSAPPAYDSVISFSTQLSRSLWELIVTTTIDLTIPGEPEPIRRVVTTAKDVPHMLELISDLPDHLAIGTTYHVRLSSRTVFGEAVPYEAVHAILLAGPGTHARLSDESRTAYTDIHGIADWNITVVGGVSGVYSVMFVLEQFANQLQSDSLGESQIWGSLLNTSLKNVNAKQAMESANKRIVSELEVKQQGKANFLYVCLMAGNSAEYCLDYTEFMLLNPWLIFQFDAHTFVPLDKLLTAGSVGGMIGVIMESLIQLAIQYIMSNLMNLGSMAFGAMDMVTGMMGGGGEELSLAEQAANGCDTSGIISTAMTSGSCGLYEIISKVVKLPMPPPKTVRVHSQVRTVDIVRQPVGQMVNMPPNSAQTANGDVVQSFEFDLLNTVLEPDLSCHPELGDPTFAVTGQPFPVQPIIFVAGDETGFVEPEKRPEPKKSSYLAMKEHLSGLADKPMSAEDISAAASQFSDAAAGSLSDASAHLYDAADAASAHLSATKEKLANVSTSLSNTAIELSASPLPTEDLLAVAHTAATSTAAIDAIAPVPRRRHRPLPPMPPAAPPPFAPRVGLAGRPVKVHAVGHGVDMRPVMLEYDLASAITDEQGYAYFKDLQFEGGGGNGAYSLIFEVDGINSDKSREITYLNGFSPSYRHIELIQLGGSKAFLVLVILAMFLLYLNSVDQQLRNPPKTPSAASMEPEHVHHWIWLWDTCGVIAFLLWGHMMFVYVWNPPDITAAFAPTDVFNPQIDHSGFALMLNVLTNLTFFLILLELTWVFAHWTIGMVHNRLRKLQAKATVTEREDPGCCEGCINDWKRWILECLPGDALDKYFSNVEWLERAMPRLFAAHYKRRLWMADEYCETLLRRAGFEDGARVFVLIERHGVPTWEPAVVVVSFSERWCGWLAHLLVGWGEHRPPQSVRVEWDDASLEESPIVKASTVRLREPEQFEVSFMISLLVGIRNFFETAHDFFQILLGGIEEWLSSFTAFMRVHGVHSVCSCCRWGRKWCRKLGRSVGECFGAEYEPLEEEAEAEADAKPALAYYSEAEIPAPGGSISIDGGLGEELDTLVALLGMQKCASHPELRRNFNARKYAAECKFFGGSPSNRLGDWALFTFLPDDAPPAAVTTAETEWAAKLDAVLSSRGYSLSPAQKFLLVELLAAKVGACALSTSRVGARSHVVVERAVRGDQDAPLSSGAGTRRIEFGEPLTVKSKEVPAAIDGQGDGDATAVSIDAPVRVKVPKHEVLVLGVTFKEDVDGQEAPKTEPLDPEYMVRTLEDAAGQVARVTKAARLADLDAGRVKFQVVPVPLKEQAPHLRLYALVHRFFSCLFGVRRDENGKFEPEPAEEEGFCSALCIVPRKIREHIRAVAPRDPRLEIERSDQKGVFGLLWLGFLHSAYRFMVARSRMIYHLFFMSSVNRRVHLEKSRFVFYPQYLLLAISLSTYFVLLVCCFALLMANWTAISVREALDYYRDMRDQIVYSSSPNTMTLETFHVILVLSGGVLDIACSVTAGAVPPPAGTLPSDAIVGWLEYVVTVPVWLLELWVAWVVLSNLRGQMLTFKVHQRQLRVGRYWFDPNRFSPLASAKYLGYQVAHALVQTIFLNNLVVFFIGGGITIGASFLGLLPGFIAASVIDPLSYLIANVLPLALVPLFVQFIFDYFVFCPPIENRNYKGTWLRHRVLHAFYVWNVSYVNMIVGLFAVAYRVGCLILVNIFAFSRLDQSIYPANWQTWDTGYKSYIAMLRMDHQYNHPVMVHAARTFILMLHTVRARTAADVLHTLDSTGIKDLRPRPATESRGTVMAWRWFRDAVTHRKRKVFANVLTNCFRSFQKRKLMRRLQMRNRLWLWTVLNRAPFALRDARGKRLLELRSEEFEALELEIDNKQRLAAALSAVVSTKQVRTDGRWNTCCTVMRSERHKHQLDEIKEEIADLEAKRDKEAQLLAILDVPGSRVPTMLKEVWNAKVQREKDAREARKQAIEVDGEDVDENEQKLLDDEANLDRLAQLLGTLRTHGLIDEYAENTMKESALLDIFGSTKFGSAGQYFIDLWTERIKYWRRSLDMSLQHAIQLCDTYLDAASAFKRSMIEPAVAAAFETFGPTFTLVPEEDSHRGWRKLDKLLVATGNTLTYAGNEGRKASAEASLALSAGQQHAFSFLINQKNDEMYVGVLDAGRKNTGAGKKRAAWGINLSNGQAFKTNDWLHPSVGYEPLTSDVDMPPYSLVKVDVEVQFGEEKRLVFHLSFRPPASEGEEGDPDLSVVVDEVSRDLEVDVPELPAGLRPWVALMTEGDSVAIDEGAEEEDAEVEPPAELAEAQAFGIKFDDCTDTRKASWVAKRKVKLEADKEVLAAAGELLEELPAGFCAAWRPPHAVGTTRLWDQPTEEGMKGRGFVWTWLPDEQDTRKRVINDPGLQTELDPEAEPEPKPELESGESGLSDLEYVGSAAAAAAAADAAAAEAAAAEAAAAEAEPEPEPEPEPEE